MIDNSSNLKKLLCGNVNLAWCGADRYGLITDTIVNGNPILKTITFDLNTGKWTLDVSGTIIDLDSLGIDDSFRLESSSIMDVLLTTKLLKLCEGVKRPPQVTVTHITLETVNGQKNARSSNCWRVLKINCKTPACDKCRRMTLTSASDKEDYVELSKTDSDHLNSLLDDLIPSAPPNLQKLIMDQRKSAVAKRATSMRWSPEVLRMALNIYTRSPQAFTDLSEFIRLPSQRLLRIYKNKVEQKAGVNPKMLRWMASEAERLKLGDSARSGGLVFDEMAIQSDIQTVRKGKSLQMLGFVSNNNPTDDHRILKGNTGREMASHVLQMVFHGNSGFRFPVCHFSTDQATASDLFHDVWETVMVLEQYRFTVEYFSMDGATNNRSFMNISFPQCDARAKLFKAPKIFNPSSPVLFIMDPKHSAKKIRNSLMKSGVKTNRRLELDTGHVILWSHLVEAFEWDLESTVRIHYKLSHEHFNLTSATKMRNHLAEEVLGEEMLLLLIEYRKSVPVESAIRLHGTIEFLRRTSIFIDIINDRIPIKKLDDARLNKLATVLNWFNDWEKNIMERKKETPAEKSKKLMTAPCRYDLNSSIGAFLKYCHIRLTAHPNDQIIPAFMNSDLIENLFSSQRGKCAGNITNPTLSQYETNMNAIILGQASVSTKSNAGRSLPNPYQPPPIKKQKK